MGTIHNYFEWLSEQEEESFSVQLLKLLRDKRGKVDIRDVRELLHLGADPNYKLLGHSDEEQIDRMIDTAREEEWDLKEVPRVRIYKMATLAYPILNHNPEVIKVMFEYGADPNLDFSDVSMATGAKTAFMYAVKQARSYNPNSIKIVDLFVEEGADVNVLDDRGNNLIHIKVQNRDFDLIEKLIELGVDPYKKNKNGETPYNLIDVWSEYTIDGKKVRGSEVRNMFSSLLEPPENAVKEPFSIFRKKK